LYKRIKWLILIIPTVTIGIWEYVRHEYMLSFVSMDLGNWLAPVIVFLVTMLLLTKLFTVLETIQAELQQSKLVQIALQERENLAKELHDGIAQSLFLMSIKIEELAQHSTSDKDIGKLQSIKQTVHEVNHYVRQSISNLRYPPELVTVPWKESMEMLIRDIYLETNIKIEYEWKIEEETLSVKEKIGLYEFIREALVNIRKHAQDAKHIFIYVEYFEAGWRCRILDDGQGFTKQSLLKSESFGLKIVRERAMELGWQFSIKREEPYTIVEVLKSSQGVD